MWPFSRFKKKPVVEPEPVLMEADLFVETPTDQPGVTILKPASAPVTTRDVQVLLKKLQEIDRREIRELNGRN